jgi:plastocyanin
MRVLCLAATAVVIAACGGGGDGGGTPPPPTVASVTITPNTPQSTTLCGEVSFTAQPKDAQGNNLSRSVDWTSSTANVVLSSTSGASVTATGVGVGSSTVTATSETVPSTGVTVTVAASGQAPTTAGVTAEATSNTFTPACVVVAAGGTVTWTFGSRTHNVIFGANKPTGGDIPDRTNTTEQRTFPTAGHYPYDCTLHPGMRGRVVVR